MSAFPDRRAYGDDVIWGGDDVKGFYSSHRVRHVGTNRGWTIYGPPTGKRVNYWGIADCILRRNRVVEEWLCRDELSLVMQLGLNPLETAREIVARAADNDLQLDSRRRYRARSRSIAAESSCRSDPAITLIPKTSCGAWCTRFGIGDF